ncbi:MAG: carboxypeptidase [Lachnospiraceae bacterium]
MKTARPRGTDEARVIQVIETKALRGLGTEEDPVREVTQYWDFEGNFLAEMDTEHCIPVIEHDAKAVKESILAP